VELSMAEVQPPSRLAARLRELRESAGWELTQRDLASALRISPSLVSSWEKATAVPSVERLGAYARFFGTRRSVEGGTPRLLAASDITGDERPGIDALQEELDDLRRKAVRTEPGPASGRPGFWCFPDGQPITVLCGPLSDGQLGLGPDGSLPSGAPRITAYARRTHPNYIRALHNGDVDALIELYGQLRAENPRTRVGWKTLGDAESTELTGHVVILGGADLGPLGASEAGTYTEISQIIGLLGLPVHTRLPSGGDPEFDTEFVVTTRDDEPAYDGPQEEVVRPEFTRWGARDAGRRLEHDVALIVRAPNPLNTSASITLCMGIFSRGTYAAVRAWTDPQLAARNEQFLADHFADPGDFWMLVRVPVIGGTRTITPDFRGPSTLLRSSP
jgi:transcriptional regulator with XRE-family HTH domain